jgi:glucosamine kinase
MQPVQATAPPTSNPAPAFLGLDAGGTQTRWALADAGGVTRRSGQVAGLTALQLNDEAGRATVATVLSQLAAQAGGTGSVQAVVAGFTGFDVAQGPQLQSLLAQTFGVAPDAVQTMNDVELICRAAFEPGEGCVVYAGTGSIAACLGADRVLHRAGGRGGVIDDAGGGHWIARRALRQVWRAEDEAPGSWQQSVMARELFEHIGGNDWLHTRAWVYGAGRGQLGTLALAVAAAAQASPPDPAALAILQDAGDELARLAQALRRRLGPLPLALAGRVFDLHPLIEQRLRQQLPAGTAVQRLTQPVHEAAARIAAAGRS